MNKRGLTTIVVIFLGLFALFFVSAIVLVAAFGDEAGFGLEDNRVGVVEVTGPIMDSKEIVANIRKFADDETIRAMVIRVDSPGGAVGPSQEIYAAVKRAKVKKPLVVSMGSVAASGGYYIACGADTIFANPGTLTGSIGVVSQVINVKGLVDKTDLQVYTFRSGVNKAAGSPLTEFTEANADVFRQMIDDVYDQFVSDVADCRKIERQLLLPLADGRVFTGRQAQKHKLVDKLGGLQAAVEHVATEAKLEGDPKLVYPPEKARGLLADMLSGSVDGLVEGARARVTPTIEYRWTGP